MDLKTIFNFRFRHNKESDYAQLRTFCQSVLGFKPQNIELYHIALTHKSVARDHKGTYHVNNERLEYLGDAMLSSIVAHYLYVKYPTKGEGYLTELRSKIVSRRSLNKIAHKMGLYDVLLYDKSAIRISGNRSIEGNALEALIGAIFLDKGYVFTQKVVVSRLLDKYLDINVLATTEWNYKGMLIDYCQKQHRKVSFVLDNTEHQGREHHAVYTVHVEIDGTIMESAKGMSIKSAEQQASERTYKRLKSAGAKP